MGAELIDAHITSVLDAAGQRREDALVDLLQGVEDRLTQETNRATRRAMRVTLSTRLATKLTDALDDDAKIAPKLIETAVERVRLRREQYLFDNLLCDCSNEGWTRSLNHCWEPCRERQRGWVRGWLAEGFTNDEILDLMVEKVGTEKVLAGERSWLTRVVPYMIFGAGVLILIVLLRAARRGGRDEWSATKDRRDATESSPENAGATVATDVEMEARLEAELENLED
jgi:cytochrome c-type biogenesis protein CcmH/NrfF